MLVTLLLAVIALSALLFLGRGFLAWVVAAGICLVGWRITGIAAPLLFETTALALTALAIVFGIPAIRRALVTRWIMPIFARVLPRLGETERIALDAGTVWWDAELFSGKPDWN